MKLTLNKVRALQRHARQPLSLDQIIGDGGNSQLGDFIENSTAVDAADVVSLTRRQTHLRSTLVALPEREAASSG